MQPLIVANRKYLKKMLDQRSLTSMTSKNTRIYHLFSLILYFDLRKSLIFGGQKRSGSSMVEKKTKNEIGTPKNYDLIPYMTYLHWFLILTSGGKQTLEVRTSRSRLIWGQKGALEWNRNTKKSMIWYLSWPIFINLIFWPFSCVNCIAIATSPSLSLLHCMLQPYFLLFKNIRYFVCTKFSKYRLLFAG